MNIGNILQRIVLAALVVPAAALAQYTSKPLDPAYYMQEPMKYTGLLSAGEHSCSGAIVKDTRIMLSASHCVFQETRANPWGPSPEWFLRYASAKFPADGQGRSIRAYWYFTGYADAVRLHSMSSPQSFNLDYMAGYSYEPLAEEAAPYFLNGDSAILQLPWKQTVGYPSGLYRSSNPYRYYMHGNGPWTAECKTTLGSYILCNEVSAGPGNSGGPVFVWDAASSRYGFAGVYVSGAERSLGDAADLSGINAMSEDEWSVVTSAIESADKGLPDDGTLNDGTPTVPGNGQRLSVFGNSSLIPHDQSAVNRADMTDFGSTTSSRAMTRTFVLANTGTSPLQFTSDRPVSITGRGARYFKIRSQLLGQLDPNEGQYLKISFSSTARGLHRATVVVQSDDPETPEYRFAVQARRR